MVGAGGRDAARAPLQPVQSVLNANAECWLLAEVDTTPTLISSNTPVSSISHVRNSHYSQVGILIACRTHMHISTVAKFIHAMQPSVSSLVYARRLMYAPLRLTRNLQLYIVVQQAHLLARLECWQPDVRTPVASECVAQGAVAAAANLPLDSEVDLGQVVCAKFDLLQVRVCSRPLLRVFGLNLLLESACAVFAGSSSLAGLGLTFWRCA